MELSSLRLLLQIELQSSQHKQGLAQRFDSSRLGRDVFTICHILTIDEQLGSIRNPSAQ